jgi:hypothetical protein
MTGMMYLYEALARAEEDGRGKPQSWRMSKFTLLFLAITRERQFETGPKPEDFDPAKVVPEYNALWGLPVILDDSVGDYTVVLEGQRFGASPRTVLNTTRLYHE